MKIEIQGVLLEVKKEGEDFFLNNKKIDFDIIKKEGTTNIRLNGVNYRVQLEQNDAEIRAFVNNKAGLAKSISREAEILERIGIQNWATTDEKDLKAPMPGKILDVLVQKQDRVEKGQALVVLEAMKMENVLKSPVDGVISELKAGKEDTVEKNQILITFDH